MRSIERTREPTLGTQLLAKCGKSAMKKKSARFVCNRRKIENYMKFLTAGRKALSAYLLYTGYNGIVMVFMYYLCYLMGKGGAHTCAHARETIRLKALFFILSIFFVGVYNGISFLHFIAIVDIEALITGTISLEIR